MIEKPDSMEEHPSLQLPDAPAELTGDVKAWSQPVSILIYAPLAADRNPMSLRSACIRGVVVGFTRCLSSTG